MKKWEEIFENVYSSSKNTFNLNKSFIYTISIILAVITSTLITLQVYDLQSQGASFIESLNPKDTNYVNSNYVVYSNIIFNVLNKLLYFIVLIFLFFKIVHKEKTFSESFGYFLKKLIPLVLTSIIYFILMILPLAPWLILNFTSSMKLIYIIIIFFVSIILLIPALIFSILWMFFTHAILFRDKSYYSALSYSKSLVSGKKLDTLNNFIAFVFKMWKLWLIPFLLIFGIIVMKNTILFLSANLIATIFYNVFYFYSIIFSIRYFLDLEQRNGISNELSTNQDNTKSEYSISQSEINAKNYIEQYKTQYPKESIRSGLINAGNPVQDVDNYINKYY